MELLRLEEARWNALERVRLNIQALNVSLHFTLGKINAAGEPSLTSELLIAVGGDLWSTGPQPWRARQTTRKREWCLNSELTGWNCTAFMRASMRICLILS